MLLLLAAALAAVGAWQAAGWPGATAMLAVALLSSVAASAFTVAVFDWALGVVTWRSTKSVAARDVLARQIEILFANAVFAADATLRRELGVTGAPDVEEWRRAETRFVDALDCRPPDVARRIARETAARMPVLVSTVSAGGEGMPEETVRGVLRALSTFDELGRVALEILPERAVEAEAARRAVAKGLHNALQQLAQVHAALR